MKRNIYLQEIGELDKSVLIKLKKNLEWSFKEFIDSVRILPKPIPLTDSEYNSSKRQYNALLIINKLTKHTRKKKLFRILGVMDKDIYSKYLNFVFGVAFNPKKSQLEFSGVALISITRLREEFYRRPENKSLTELRTLKEAIHELGHTLGLDHCENSCIMRFSNCLADTDAKPPNFCTSCLKALNEFLKS